MLFLNDSYCYDFFLFSFLLMGAYFFLHPVFLHDPLSEIGEITTQMINQGNLFVAGCFARHCEKCDTMLYASLGHMSF